MSGVEDRYVITRPAEYSVAPQYRPQVVESHLSKYVLEVDPIAFDTDRASFSYRSPGLGTLQNATVELAFSIRVTARRAINYVANMGPQIQLVDISNQTGAGASSADCATMATGSACKLAFGSGDAMQKGISSIQIIVNGAPLAQSRQRDYMRSLQKCWFDKGVFQKRFGQCGGTPNQYDARAVQGELCTRLNAANSGDAYTGAERSGVVAGFTGDSGVSDRLRNLLACQVNLEDGDANLTDVRDFRVRWRINGTGLFNPLSPNDRISESCPYKQSARALPHMNIVSINILFQDLMKALVRRLSSIMGDTAGAAADGLAASGRNEITVVLTPAAAGSKAGTPKLFVEFLRLPSWRQQSGTALIQTFRVAVHDPTTDNFTGGVTMPTLALDGTALPGCLLPVGTDRKTGRAGAWNGGVTRYRECQWGGITAAQLPQYLFVVLEKSLELTSHGEMFTQQLINTEVHGASGYRPGAAANGRLDAQHKIQFMARNTDGNAAITQFQLEIMSVQGSYIYSSEAWPFIKSRGDLYRDVQKYCIDTYDDMDTWFKNNCIVFLGVQEFAKGISSSGTAFPCTFKVKARFENWRTYIDGHACTAVTGAGLAACCDVIGGRPVLGMIYPQQSLQISASSALLSTQNISHASAIELLARERAPQRVQQRAPQGSRENPIDLT